jgi:hypothetical protein
MKFSAVTFLALFAGASAFAPQTSRVMGRVAARVPESKTVMLAGENDDIEKTITRTGLLVGLGFPIAVAPYAGALFCVAT